MTNDSPEVPPESIPEFTVQRLFEERQETLQLEVLTSDISLERRVLDPDLSSPGLALAGYTERFSSDRMQVFGETEIAYLEGLTPEERRERVKGVFSFGIPVAFVTKALSVPDQFLEVAAECSIPILRSGLSTKEFYRRIKPYLDAILAASPDSAQDRVLRALVLTRLERKKAARRDVDWLLEHEPEGVSLPRVRQLRDYLEQEE